MRRLTQKLSTQKGMTLIELMIATSLSLIIMYFITNIMVTSSRTAMQAEGLSQAQENGRFILSWLQANVRSAGSPYPSDVSQERIQPFADVCASSTVVPPAANADCSFDASAGSGSDRIAVRRTFVNDPVFASENSNISCSGETITTVSDGDEITDVYWVDKTSDAYGGVLKCATYNNQHQIIGSVQEIANGIEGLQVLYGVAADEDFQYRSITNRYIALSDLGDPVEWDKVSAIRISILTRAFTERSTDKKKRSYILLDATPVTYDDAVARHIQTTTIFLANE